MVIRIMLNPKSVDMEGVTTLAQAQAQAANEQLRQGIEERNRQAIAAWEARTGLKYDPDWQAHTVRPDGPFRESTGSYIREGTIRNGEWNGEVREYKDGVLRKISNYKNGWESLARKLYREDGTLALDRSLNEDGNIVDVHYGEDGKTEDYRLVLDRHRKVLFDSRQQAEEKQEAPAGPEVAGLLTGPTELEVEPEATEEQPSTAMDAQEALNRAGERFRNRRAAEALAQDTALPETGAEGESDLDGLAGNTAMSVGEPKRGDTIVRRTTFDVEDDEGRNVGFRYYVSGTAIAAASLLIDDKSTYVERLDVDDKYQNMGFGTRILQQLADEYGDVYVAPDNEDAKRLYERIGYDEVGSRAYNESYYAVDEGYGVYSISGDSDTNIVIEGEDDGAGNVALSVGEDGTKGVDPGRVKSGLSDFAKEWKSRGGLEYGDERELNAILDGANRFMDAYFGGAIALSNGGVLRFYPDRRAIERLGLERAWMEYAIHAVTQRKSKDERVRIYNRAKAKAIDSIREIIAADKCVIDKGDLVFIGDNGMSVIAEIVNKNTMRFDEERYITTRHTENKHKKMAAVPVLRQREWVGRGRWGEYGRVYA